MNYSFEWAFLMDCWSNFAFKHIDCFCFRWKCYETMEWRDGEKKMRLRLQIGKDVKDSSYLPLPCLDHHGFHIPLEGKTQICKMDQTRATLSTSQRHSRKTWWAVAFLLLSLIPRFLCESCEENRRDEARAHGNVGNSKKQMSQLQTNLMEIFET